MMIKSKFSNQVHKLLEPNINIKRRDRWRHLKNYNLTDKEKLEIFDKILELHQESSKELTNYQYDRREKKRVHKARIERGWKPKEKNNLEKQ